MGSVAPSEKQRCAMGKQCVWFAQDGEPAKLSDSNPEDICESCRRVGRSATESASSHEELFHAARVLLREEVDDNDLIIPTLAFAARASVADPPWLVQLKDLFLNAGGSSEAWESLWRLFIDTFYTLQPDRIVDGVPILRRVDLYVRVFFDSGPAKPKARVVKEIYIDAYSRSVKPHDVKAKYEKSLKMAGIPWERWDRGSVSYIADKGYLRLLVRSEDTEGVIPIDRITIRSGEQLPFPPPAVVESVYEGVWKHFGNDALTGKQKEGYFKPENLIPACVACYIEGHGELASNPKVPPKVVRALDRYLLEPLGKEGLTLKSASSNRTRQIREAVKNAYPLIDRVDQELRDKRSWRRFSQNLSD